MVCIKFHLKKTDTSNLVCTTNALQHLPILCQTIYGNYVILCDTVPAFASCKKQFSYFVLKGDPKFFFCFKSGIRSINYSVDKTQSFSCNRNVIKFIWSYGYFSSSNKDLKNVTSHTVLPCLLLFLF